jgi:hypothetical protein
VSSKELIKHKERKAERLRDKELGLFESGAKKA